MANTFPELHVIPYANGFRIEWTNPCPYTNIVLRGLTTGQYTISGVVRDYIVQDAVDITALVGTDGLKQGAFNSVTTASVNAQGRVQYLGSQFGSRLLYGGQINAITLYLVVTLADGTVINQLSRDNASAPRVLPAPRVADPGATAEALVVPTPLSDAHRIDEIELERACMKFIPARLRCEWDGGFGRLARLIGCADFDKVSSIQKLAEEIYPSTTDLAVGELENEFFDLAAGCYVPSNTLAVRRRAILARKRSRGGNTRAWLQDTLTTLGFRGTEIIETQPTRFGDFRVGDSLQRLGVWIKWDIIVEAIDATQQSDTISALSCILSETRQRGVFYFIANDKDATTFQAVP